ncbi:cellulase family glycosylhydrolase [Streptomyces longispororuber]|uniref:cellulase family glycosylhydrolase n=1 Tax=Streptomyces longispororuber TaxID=68230 RepID=UPI00210A393A|nr:cellulase family glycosylhydrolase [Streptomyces longispororuber]MCQ4206302.1 cellulase family glycosylhydrolase [Streptomyces longispororuber]
MPRSAARISPDGRPVTWIGANFWSRSGGPLMWRSYDPGLVAEELRVLRDHGLNMTRSFFYWPDFMPEPDRIDEELCGHYADFLDRHHALGLTTVPTFLVGHMSGENWDPAWRGGRDLYGDVWLVARQAWFVREITRRFKDHPAVAGWLISNEMPIYGARDTARDVVESWAQLVVDAVRAGGGTQPVSLGDGAWGIENSGHDNGFSVRDAARLCDWLGPHVYRMENDPVRQHYAAAWVCELTSTFDRPVILEEFGITSAFASDENAATYYRQALHNSLLSGATGWIAWNNTDYDTPALRAQPPYRHHAFELYFGLTDSAGRPKPQLSELRAFSEVLADVEWERCARADTDTALVVSSYLDTPYPFTRAEDRSYVQETGRQAWIAARLADAPATVVRESDGELPDGYRLYLAPSVKQLLAPTWYRLEELARGGATVYVSYSPGAHEEQRGPWYARLDELFGVRHQLTYGLVNPIEDDEVTFAFERDFGSLGAGTRLTLRAAGTEHSRCFLPVAAGEGAEVVAVDGRGRPALVERAVGAGRLVLCTYPVEHMAAVTPRVNPEATGVLYDALAVRAGVRRPVTVADQRVAVDLVEHAAGHRWVWLVSQCATELPVKPVVARGWRLTTRTGESAEAVTLPPYGVLVLRLDAV